MYSRSGHLAFVDFLFILLLAFISMFILALLLINPIPKKSEIERKAEYIVTLEWHKKSYDDIDIWIEDPVRNLLSFKNSGFRSSFTIHHLLLKNQLVCPYCFSKRVLIFLSIENKVIIISVLLFIIYEKRK